MLNWFFDMESNLIFPFHFFSYRIRELSEAEKSAKVSNDVLHLFNRKKLRSLNASEEGQSFSSFCRLVTYILFVKNKLVCEHMKRHFKKKYLMLFYELSWLIWAIISITLVGQFKWVQNSCNSSLFVRIIVQFNF